MPLRRFNLEDHHFAVCTTVSTRSMDVADKIADRLVQEKPDLLLGGRAIVVRDQDNRQIYRAQMDSVSITRRRQSDPACSAND